MPHFKTVFNRTSALMGAFLLIGSLLTASLPALSAPPATTKKPVAKKSAPATAGKTAQKPAAVAKPLPDSAYTQISSLDLLKSPDRYLNNHVEMVGVFNRFSDTALDYKKAFRDSRDYVSLFILRPEVEPHKIPLAELKLFFPRKKSEEVMSLESGDTIRIRGSVFSAALNEPWVDVESIKVLQKTKESTKKADAPEF